MENLKQKESPIEIIIIAVNELISEFEKQAKISYTDYQEFEKKLNDLQKEISGKDSKLLEQFETRMSAIYERVKDKPADY